MEQISFWIPGQTGQKSLSAFLYRAKKKARVITTEAISAFDTHFIRETLKDEAFSVTVGFPGRRTEMRPSYKRYTCIDVLHGNVGIPGLSEVP